ncbi:MAG TPA: NAD(P)-binding domain-containing protein, partial [Candidatus Nitrosocosmicus sp.]|nr:NAD(P)-binding domain-containing protein [Candidatus Nitrosocosmicus sp.]
MAGRNGASAAARTKRNGGSPLPGFEAKVQNGTARIGIIGLGYVGLPLAVEFAKKGFRVTGFEINKK